MNTNEIEMLSTETGGSDRKDQITSIAKEPVLTDKDYLKYINETKKQIRNLRKDVAKLKVTNEDIAGLEKRATEVEVKFDSLERRMDRSSSNMMNISTIVVTVVLGTAVLIALDYFKYNEERYEKFIDRTEVIKEDTKKETASQIKSFKDCISNNGLHACIK